MRFEHRIVYKISGITSINGSDITLVSREEVKARLTAAADVPCAESDRSLALANMLLRGLVGGGPGGPFEERLEAETAEVLKGRTAKHGNGPFLVVEFNGEIPPLEDATERELDQLVIRLNGSPKEAIKAAGAPIISALVSAIALESKHPVTVERVCRSIVFFRDDGKPVYSFKPTASGQATVSSRWEEGLDLRVADRFDGLVGAPSLERVVRLYQSSLEEDDDPLRSFLAAWSAMEIFVSKVFSLYEVELFDDLRSRTEAGAYQAYLDRILEVMKDKYRLADKFSVIAVKLAPSGADEDLKEFKAVKKVRDALAHGQDVDENRLPVSATRSLLLKYLGLHLDNRDS